MSGDTTPANEVFRKALQKHIDIWKSDARSFSANSSPQDVLQEVQNYEDKHRKKVIRRYADRFSTLVQQFQGFFSAVDVFVSADPHIAGLVWGGLRFVIQIVQNFSTYFEKLVCVLETISRHLRFYHDYATDLYKDSVPVMEALADVYGDILSVLMTVKRTFINSRNEDRSGFLIALYVLNPFQRPFDIVTLNFERRRAILEEETKHAERKLAHQQQKLDKFLDILRFVDCSPRHAISQGAIRPDENPGRWLLERDEFRKWSSADLSTSSGLLWVHGKAGSGKTILSSIVIETLKSMQHNDTTVAFFYCEHQDPDRRDLSKLLSSILYQIMRTFKPPLPISISQLIDRHSADLSLYMLNFGDLICEVAAEHKSVFLVIDALDECENVARLLPTLLRLAGSMRLYVTSRDYGDTERNLKGYPHCEIAIRPGDVQVDIEQFVKKETEEHLRQNRSFVNEALVTEITDKLIKGANGMFLWVTLQLKHILKQKTTHDIRVALDNLPQDLDKTFIRSIQTIDAQPSRERLKRVLKWVVCAARPLTLAEIAEAVAIDEMDDGWDPERVVNDPPSLIDDCADLLSVMSGEVPVVELIHFSVHSFLTSNPGLFKTTLPEYHVYPLTEAHVEIARKCLRYFTVLSPHVDDPARFTFREYATVCWTSHVECSASAKETFASLGFTQTPDPIESLRQTMVFPLATHVTLIDCQFNRSAGSQYNVFLATSDTSLGFGMLSFEEVFPLAIEVDVFDSVFSETEAQQHITYHSSVMAAGPRQETEQDLHATRVTVRGFTFTLALGTRYYVFPASSQFIESDEGKSGTPFGGRDLSVNDSTFWLHHARRQFRSIQGGVVYGFDVDSNEKYSVR